MKTATAGALRRPRRLRAPAGRTLLLVPVAAFYGLLFLWPLVEILRGGLADAGGSWRALDANPVFSRVVTNTLVIGVLTTTITIVLAYLLAYVAWRSTGTRRLVVFAFVLLPFWTGVLVKTFAWTQILQTHGAINVALQRLGLTDAPLALLHNRLAVVVGMVHYCLPYAVFPIFAAMAPLDRRLEEAATSLGAGRVRLARHVIVPLTLPGVLAAALLVFIIAIGFFITPVLLGGPGDRMVANLIDYYQRQIVNFQVASLLALLVTAAVSLLVLVHQRLPKEGQHGRG